MIRSSNRLENIQEYYFSKKLREVQELLAQGKSIINLGIGSPDLAPDVRVIAAMQNSINDANAHAYQSYQGLPEFRKTIEDFYNQKYRVRVNQNNEILPLMGSKEGILHISMAFLNKGDAVLIPNPGYPTYTSVTRLVDAKPIFYNLDIDHHWQPDFEALESLELSEVKIMWVNYPHMPTGAIPRENTFQKLVTFGKKHHILIVNDNPYSFILNDKPQSILEIEGAKDVALELNSLSKSFNMAGWRVGMLLGSESHIKKVLKVKTQMDSGMFYGIQKGAIAALASGVDWFNNLNKLYGQRRELVWELADKLKCNFDKNSSGLFVWAKLPTGKTAEKMVDFLLRDKHIFVAPGTVFGSRGEGYIRFSLCVSEEKIKEAIHRI
ncbi:MAG: aminotransferase class I/II-fold pyridoxal phosphate-dependent enzyme [Flavobacteriaceae bacterium]|nr:MAG: aminotransferase class I/II-fold pyridoxal phosphate-dependent enzyme [Flavobacteriaceae bacterium]